MDKNELKLAKITMVLFLIATVLELIVVVIKILGM